ncbi:MAG: PfkB family carbohydrate kinase [Chloroflexi bacterium]|nr:PfkB family carbohydrate kinase [Chloroflexota bacterium]
MTPDFLAIGHVAKDLTPDGYRLGGAVTYGSLTALKLGLRPAAVASAGPDVDICSALSGISVSVVPSAETTTFNNIYADGRRRQLIKAVGGPIEPSDVPQAWRSAPLVMLGPLVPRMSYELARIFDRATVVACIQGWMRRWDEQGSVSPARWEGAELLPHVDAAILSIDDLDDERLIDVWKELAPVLIVTRGREGAELHLNGKSKTLGPSGWHHIAAFPTTEVDPTGAGDVFAAAYLVRLGETGDPLEAARFASCAASFSVEAEGTGGIPTRAQVEARLRISLQS